MMDRYAGPLGFTIYDLRTCFGFEILSYPFWWWGGGDDFGKEYFGVDKELDIAGFPLNYIQRIFSNL